MSPLYQALGAGRIPQMSDFCCILQLQGGASCIVGLFEVLCKRTQENLTPDCSVPNAAGTNAAGSGSEGVLYGVQNRLFVVSEHPPSRISIHRCYKRSGRPVAECPRASAFVGIGGRVCKILHVN